MDDIELKVTRLVAGTASGEDLAQIFDWLRFRSFGCEIVRDIGDLAICPDEYQNRQPLGPSRQWAEMLRFKIIEMQRQKTPGETALNLLTLSRGARANLRHLESATIMRQTGVRKKKAEKILDAILEKVTSFDGRYLKIRGSPNTVEEAVLRCATSHIVLQPALTDTQLIEDLARCLARNKLVGSKDVRKIRAQRDFVGVFAIERMHQLHLKVQDDAPIVLQGGVNSGLSSGKLHVAGFVSSALGKIGGTVFETSIAADRWCDLELITDRWAWPIELGPDRKLRKAVTRARNS